MRRVKHGRGSVMVWAATLWFSVSPMITLQGHITATNYVNILTDQFNPMVQCLFPNIDDVFQDDEALVLTGHIIQDWFS